jgi:hypothetical protein
VEKAKVIIPLVAEHSDDGDSSLQKLKNDPKKENGGKTSQQIGKEGHHNTLVFSSVEFIGNGWETKKVKPLHTNLTANKIHFYGIKTVIKLFKSCFNPFYFYN